MAETQAATDLLEAIAGYGGGDAGRSVRLARVDPSYGGGLVKVRFDGESALSGKGYPWLAAYNPASNDRVALLPVGTSYLILGRVKTA